MSVSFGERLQAYRTRRHLRSDDRSARFARAQAWERITYCIRQYWWAMGLMVVLFVGAVTPLALRLEGAYRGAVYGAAAVSALWFDALITILWSGAASQIMGVSGETATADILRGLESKGWRIANGVKLDGWREIDHLAVGPGGVLVVETKWSAYPWPLKGGGPTFMESDVKNAAIQVQKNTVAVKEWLSAVAPMIPTTGIVVFWTGGRKHGSGSTMSKQWGREPAVLVFGPSFQELLAGNLWRYDVDDSTVDRVWSRLVELIQRTDETDEYSGENSPPTLRGLFIDWAIKPFVGFAAAAYAFSLMRFLHGWWLPLVATAVGIGLGWGALRVRSLRRVAIGWTATLGAFFIVLLVIVAVDLIR